VADLGDDEVEEGLPVADGEQGLGAVQAHGGAEAAVELDHDGLGESVVCLRLVDVHVCEAFDVGEGADRLLGDQAGLAGGGEAVVVREDRAGSVVRASGTHLFQGLGQPGLGESGVVHRRGPLDCACQALATMSVRV